MPERGLHSDYRGQVTEALYECPTLFELLDKDSRGDRDITILDHSIDTLIQSYKYPVEYCLSPDLLSPTAFRKFLSVHDGGKSIPEKKEQAAKITIEVIENHNKYLRFSNREMDIIRGMLIHDPIGRVMHRGVNPFGPKVEEIFNRHRNSITGDVPLYIREQYDVRYQLRKKHDAGQLDVNDIIDYSKNTKAVELTKEVEDAFIESAENIKESAAIAKLPKNDFLSLLKTFYMYDISAYSMDVGLRKIGLEFLLEINPGFLTSNPRQQLLFKQPEDKKAPMIFSPAAKVAFNRLDRLVNS